MNFEPQKFFIGLMDFFTILLPGAFLTYLLKDQAVEFFLGSPKLQLNNTEGGLVFLFSSYLLGHFIFLLGTWLDELYDIFRKYTLNTRIRYLAWTGKLSPQSKLLRCLLWMAFKGERNQAVEAAKRIKGNYLNSLQAGSVVNTFQWAKLRLAEQQPAALSTVQRFEADSKFFRSLVVVFFLLPFFAGDCERMIKFAAIAVLLMPLAFWRYIEQRHKATNQAYWSIIALEGKSDDKPYKSYQNADGASHAGGIVYRQKKHCVEYLLVQAEQNPSEWVLPKGKIELNEHSRETAVREVHEETGVWAKIREDLKIHDWQVKGMRIKVQLYLMESIEERWITGPRQHQWLTLETIRKSEFELYPETLSLLKLVDAKLKGYPK